MKLKYIITHNGHKFILKDGDENMMSKWEREEIIIANAMKGYKVPSIPIHVMLFPRPEEE